MLHYFTEKGVDCNLILLSDDLTLKHEIPISIPVSIIKKLYKFDLKALYKLRNKLKKHAADLVFSFTLDAFHINTSFSYLIYIQVLATKSD